MYEVDIGELRKIMTDCGFDTIDSLSEAANVNRNTVADVVKGRAFPSSIVMQKIGEALSMSGDQMGKVFFKRKLA